MNFAKMFSVEGKIVLVTGGGGGIGKGIAGAFVHGGAKVYIASRSDLGPIANDLSKYGKGSCHALQCDLSKEDEITKLVETLNEKEGKLDVLVNNAALGGYMGKFDKFPMKYFDRMNAVNVRAPFQLIKECIPLLTTAGVSTDQHASVINIVSIDGIRIPADDDWAYGQGKAALIHLTKMLAGRMSNNYGKEKHARKITYNAIAPGPFPGMLDVFLKTEEGRKAVGGSTVIGRVGRPEDIGASCIYLSSRAGSYVNGAVLPVDGGGLVGRYANM